MKIYVVFCKAPTQAAYNIKVKADGYDWHPITAKDVCVRFTAGGKVVAEFIGSEILGIMLADAAG